MLEYDIALVGFVTENRTCLADQFSCEQQRHAGQYHCLPNSWRCDKSCDCSDCSDERDCPSVTCRGIPNHPSTSLRSMTFIFLPDEVLNIEGDVEFKCPTVEVCLVYEEKCDGVQHCPDGYDEAHCSKLLFTTVYPLTLIRPSLHPIIRSFIHFYLSPFSTLSLIVLHPYLSPFSPPLFLLLLLSNSI